ncbi:MAG: hypothetical protein AAGA67_05300 [Cyanobacteria bacterium P01_F01_bin.153]
MRHLTKGETNSEINGADIQITGDLGGAGEALKARSPQRNNPAYCLLNTLGPLPVVGMRTLAWDNPTLETDSISNLVNANPMKRSHCP